MRSIVDQKAATIARSAARRAKYQITSYDVHGYTLDVHMTESWSDAVDYAREQQRNPLFSVADIDPTDGMED